MTTPSLREIVVKQMGRVSFSEQASLRSLSAYVGLGVAALLGFVVLATVFHGLQSIVAGNLQEANTYASLASGFATVILVVLTAWYSLETRRMVLAQEQSRKKEKVEKWYGKTLSLCRLLEERWEQVEADGVTKTDNQRGETYYVTDEELLRSISSTIDELSEHNSHRPSFVSQELSESIHRVSTEWVLISSGEQTFTYKDSVLKDEIPRIKKFVFKESELYGKEEP